MKSISIFIIAFFTTTGLVYGQQVQLVNMIPNAQSNETNQDSEPNLAINPANPNQMAGSAFTPNLLGSPNAPIYVSVDGGQTWLLNSIVPSQDALVGTGDITNRFGTTSNRLYAGILRRPAAAGASRTMDILRTNNFLGATAMQVLSTRNQPDQPFIQTASVLSGTGIGQDRVYVGSNDLGGTNGQTATIDQTLNGQTAAPVFNATRLDSRTSATMNDAPPVRTAIHPDGIIYSTFFHQRSLSGTVVTGDIVVVRDNNWGNGATPFSNLLDPNDGLVGNRIVTGITCPFSGNSLGQERIWQRMNIAVDPNNSARVYVVYSDFPTGVAPYTLHVRRSTDSGEGWSADIRTVTNATVPSLAINNLGELAFSYQRLVAGNWQTIVERTTNDFATTATTTLNTFPDGTPARVFSPYLGDYAYLTAMPSGKDFCGIFSASNNPNAANFPTVQPLWQRNVNAATNQLRNLTNTGNVNASIDPFFFRISPLNLEQDFYVRDWTNSPASHDQGEEPSDINFWFQFNSDVWNRRSNGPGTFNANDRPANQNVQPVGLGHNFAFARVHRKAAGAAETVNLLFLKSEFGTGSNFQLINGVSSFSSLNFGPTDLNVTMTNGVQWDLVDPNAVTNDHPCMAVEIATATDPSANPTLLGRAPGWSNGTDLLVISDNNKAQRNLHVYTGGADSEASGMLSYAVVHSPTFFERDVRILVIPQNKAEALKPTVSVRAGKEQGRNIMRGDTLILLGMKPCENRWVELSMSLPAADLQETPTVIFKELVGAMAVNGFAIGVKSGSKAEFAWENLAYHQQAFDLLAKRFNNDKAAEQAKRALELLQNKPAESDYQAFLEKYGTVSAKLTAEWQATMGPDAFELNATLEEFIASLKKGNWSKVSVAHANFTHKLLAYLSYLHKMDGDVADILQTIRWQRDLMVRSDVFKNADLAQKAILAADKFIEVYSKIKLTNEDYPAYVKENLKNWQDITGKYFPNEKFDPFFDELKANLNNPQRLQKSHCRLVSKMASLVGL